MTREEMRQLALIGARIQLVELEKARANLFRMFPELEQSYQRAAVPKTKVTKPKQSPTKRKAYDTQAKPRTLAFMRDLEKPILVTDLAEHFKMLPHTARSRLDSLKDAGLVRVVRKKVDGQTRAFWELTSKGEERAELNGTAS